VLLLRNATLVLLAVLAIKAANRVEGTIAVRPFVSLRARGEG
jgi:hypothetical protein